MSLNEHVLFLLNVLHVNFNISKKHAFLFSMRLQFNKINFSSINHYICLWPFPRTQDHKVIPLVPLYNKTSISKALITCKSRKNTHFLPFDLEKKGKTTLLMSCYRNP